MTRSLSLLLIITACLSSCSADDDAPTLTNFGEIDYLIFGWYFGECAGEECVETFRLTDRSLFEDVNDPYSGSSAFRFMEQLSREKFERASIVAEEFPSQLLQEPDQTFGCPDCADQGGMFIQVSSLNGIQTWRLDQDKTDVPEYLHDFMDEVNETIIAIQ